MNVKDFTLNTSLNQQTLLIKQADEKETKNHKAYLKMILCDSTGEISGNLWDTNATEELSAGHIIIVDGKITSYQDQLQIKFEKVIPSTSTDYQALLPTAPENYDQLKNELMTYYSQIDNPVYKLIVKTLLKKHEREFLTYPAAKSVHHNFYHGLLFHTVSMLRQITSYTNQYPQLNRELMYSAAIIHDMGKTIELSGILNTEYTTTGKLLGHISIIDGEINRIAQSANIPENNQNLLLLRHMVLSHHGLLEYGSPVEPQLLEAKVLHLIDESDANINTITNRLNQTNSNEWTSKIWSQNNHQFLKI